MLVANDELVDANDIDRMFVIAEDTKNLIINWTKTLVIEQKHMFADIMTKSFHNLKVQSIIDIINNKARYNRINAK